MSDEVEGDVAIMQRRRPGRPTISDEDLLDIAIDLFFDRGFDGTSIEAITAAAGMAKRTVYARYGDKDRLFQAALTRAIEKWIVPVERLRGEETDDLDETLLRIGRILLANVLSPEGLRLLRLSNAESVRMPEISSENVRLGTEPTLNYLSDLFRRRLGGPDRQFPDADDAAKAFLSIVVGGVASNAAWGMSVEPEGIERHTRFSVNLFLHGLLGRNRRDEGGDAAEVRRLLKEAQDAVERARSLIK